MMVELLSATRRTFRNDTPPVDGEQSQASVVGLHVESPIKEWVHKSITKLKRIFRNLLTLTKIAKWNAYYGEVFDCELHQWEPCDKIYLTGYMKEHGKEMEHGYGTAMV